MNMSAETTYCDHNRSLTSYCEECNRGVKPWFKCEPHELKRVFDTGASRDTDTDKLDFEGFIDPIVLKRYAEYMHENRFMRDGTIRDSDNWQRGISYESYMKSGLRHTMDWWQIHRGHEAREDIEEALCGVIFNAMGYLHEHLKQKEHERHNKTK
jgi:hypothetical protein